MLIDALALEKLRAVQSKLPAGLGLILTRGYEAKSSNLGLARRQLRAAGIMLFKLFYPQRRNELLEIFGSNGHDVDGNHVDVSISLNGRRVELLPLSVFTPEAWQQRRVRKSAGAVELVQAALKDAGFRIHRNPTESLQIHCDLIPSETK
ncbi:hypothetical protein QO058_25575 [Bosea vestrisii]|uniref:hypothetical protein n=1 Tax=Bosea vestrisii TaxID=151416 RepID=UPI0024E007D5|nr:hypothetical protein [Bosea vestrisii]WID96069.1 hypothetical protein QO058_25575 [Bosea vestrisii]